MDEEMFTMKREVVGRRSVVRDDLFQSVDKNICEWERITISELSCEFQKFHALLSRKLSQSG
jgi:hypothetical protein